MWSVGNKRHIYVTPLQSSQFMSLYYKFQKKTASKAKTSTAEEKGKGKGPAKGKTTTKGKGKR